MARSNRYVVRYDGTESPIYFVSIQQAHIWANSMGLVRYRIVKVASR